MTIRKRRHLEKDNSGKNTSEKGKLWTSEKVKGVFWQETSDNDIAVKGNLKKGNSGKEESEKGQFWIWNMTIL